MNNDNPPAFVRRILDTVRNVHPTHDGWDAHCPCPNHNGDGDQHPSLRIAIAENGNVLLKCRVGCETYAVLEAVGLDWPDLFPPDGENTNSDEGTNAEAHVLEHKSRREKAGPGLCQQAYELLLAQLTLSDEHRSALIRRGLSDPEIDRRGYRSLRNVDRGRAAKVVHEQLGDVVFTVPGFEIGDFGATLHGGSTGLLVPVRELNGQIQAIKIRRQQEPKYVYLTGGDSGPSPGSPIHVPLGIIIPSTTVRVTEGELKADICTSLDDTPTIGVPGVTQWRGSIAILKSLGAKTVILAFDSPDVHLKPPVFEQAEAFWRALTTEGFDVEMEDWYDVPQRS